MRIAYLVCALTLPDSPERRPDAFEHDLMMEALSTAFGAAGDTIEAVRWDDRAVDSSSYDAVLIGSTWDYQDRLDEFLAVLTDIEGKTRLFNPTETVRWNARKTYLRDLEARGVAVVPTIWLDRPEEFDPVSAFDRFETDDLVAKRQVGANAEGQHLLKRGDPHPAVQHPMMVQPFLPAIAAEGEFSFVFIDGTFSHALLKTAADGEYRIQSSYGGNEQAVEPNETEVATARSVLAALDHTPLYARVDMLRGEDGELLLMELELIEPYLYPEQTDDLGERIHAALLKRLDG